MIVVLACAVNIFTRLGYVRLSAPLGVVMVEALMFKPELVISTASAVMATAAVAATIWQGVLTRQHNRKSVTPHLRIDSGIDDDGCVIVKKSNRGVGPANIHRTECVVDEVPPKVYGGRGLRSAVVTTGLEKYHYIYSVPVSGEFIGVGESSLLIKFDKTDDATQEIIKSSLSRIAIHVIYECVYGKTHCVMHTPFAWERSDAASRKQLACITRHMSLTKLER